MIESQFDEQMTRLTQEFGKYSSAKLKIFWDHYRSMPYYLFSEVVTELIGSYEKKPLKPQFDKAIISAKARAIYSERCSGGADDLPAPEDVFTPDEAWIDKTGEKLARIDPNYNHERTKKIMMGIVKSVERRRLKEARDLEKKFR